MGDAEVVITCFPESKHVQALLDGPDGLIAGLKRGATLVDCTSGDPATSRAIAKSLEAHGVGFLDAPVSGGVSGAEKGTLTVMVGGDATVLDGVRPVLDTFAKLIVLCGGTGAGDSVKAVNQAFLAIHLLAAAEGLATLVKEGVNPKLALDVINASSGRSNSSMNLILNACSRARFLARSVLRFSRKTSELQRGWRATIAFPRRSPCSRPISFGSRRRTR